MVDERGIWVDLEVIYGGGLILIFEGYLNIEGYLSYFLSFGNSEYGEVFVELEMVVLLRKYEMIDNESFDLEDLENDFELESLFDSDFDFELFEFDFEEFIIKVFKLLDKLEDGL